MRSQGFGEAAAFLRYGPVIIIPVESVLKCLMSEHPGQIIGDA